MPPSSTRKLTKKNLNRAFLAIKQGKVKSLQFKYLVSYILKGDFKKVRQIVDADGFDPYQTLNSDGETIMHAAARSEGGRRMCQLLYNAGGSAVMNERSKVGLTPLHIALHFDFSCSDVDRDTAIWFLEKGALLLPFPDITSIVDDIQMSKDNILEYMESHEGAKRYDENNNNNNENNESNDETNEENYNNASVGNSIFNENNNNNNENNDYEDPEFSVSLANLDKVLAVAKRLQKIYIREIKFHFLQETTLENDYTIYADVRMTVAQFKDTIRIAFLRKGSEFDILSKQRGKVVKMEDEDHLSKYKIQNGTSVTIVITVQSGLNSRTRKLKKRV